MEILISAGEASGENYGAMLIAELRERLGEQARFFGVGGARMKEAGSEILVDSAAVAAVGITEVVKHVAQIYREFFRVVSIARQRRPAVAVLIDFPDFNLRLAQKLHEMHVPVVYFVSPQLWAWKRRRIWRVRKFVDRMLVIFPFEEDYYRKRGVEARFVGHPLADLELPQVGHEDFARKYNFDASRRWIALLPGSRKKEVLLNLPVMLESARQLESEYEYLLPVASTLSASWVAEQVAGSGVHLVDNAREALFHARAAVVASGTATVEAALIGTPFLVVYRVSRLTYAIGRRLVKVPHYGMVNLIAGRRIVPELIQQDFTPAKVTAELEKLLPDGSAREEMITNLRRVRQMLQPAGQAQDSAIARAAEAVIECLCA